MTSLPEKNRFDPPSAFAEKANSPSGKTDFAASTLRQLEKDFALQGISLSLPEKVPPYPELLDRIAKVLDRENSAGGEALIRLLYQIDTDESTIRDLLASTPAEHTLHALADQMVRRCLDKVVTRRKYS